MSLNNDANNDIKNFPTPHCHPQSLDSASTPEAFAQKEKELGTGTLTVTDHGTLSACRKIYDLAKKEGLIPIIGVEGYLSDPDCRILTLQGHKPKEYAKYFHVTSHFLDQTAFETASKLISTAPYERHGEEYKPLFTWDNYAELGAQNTILMSGCLIGLTQRHLLDHGSPENAEAYYCQMRSMAKPGNFYAEVFPHVCDRNWDSGIVIEINEGDKITSLKLKPKKKVRTNIGDVYAEDLAREFNRKDNKHEMFLGQMDYRVWNIRETPVRIVKVEKREGYLQNECTPFAPDGDVQKGGNDFVLRMARKYGDKILISDDSHFANPDDKAAQDVRLMAGGGSWRMANCFEGSTPVNMADGSLKRISDIKIGDMVKTFDFKLNRVVEAKVNAIMVNEANPNDFCSKQFLGYNGRGQRRNIIATKDHLFWDGSNWIENKKLEQFSIKAPCPNDELLQIINGVMLGDASISLSGRSRNIPYFSYGHAEDQKQLIELMSDFLDQEFPKFLHREKSLNVQKFGTVHSAHHMFESLFKKWYINGKKIVPKDVKLTPLTLAWWYMDDGSRLVAKKRYDGKGKFLRKTIVEKFHFYTMGFTVEDVDRLVSQLKTLGIESIRYIRIRNGKNHPYISLNKENGYKLQAIIAEHIPPALQYKLSDKFKNKYINTNAGFVGETIFQKKKIKISNIGKNTSINNKIYKIDLTKKYDIEVDSHHCFFVDDILVHNSYHRLSGMECWNYFNTRMGISKRDFQEWVANAQEFGQRFKDFNFNYHPELPSRFYPEDTLGYLKQTIMKHGRMQWADPRYTDRLKREISLFHDNGVVDLLPYFFVYEEAAELYRKNGKLVAPGRGSAAGVLIAYLMGITHVDPILTGLSLERFITLDRIRAGSFPDIDFDLCDRTLLVGGEVEIYECETDDGRSLTYNKGDLVKTEFGMMKIEEAIRRQAEII